MQPAFVKNSLSTFTVLELGCASNFSQCSVSTTSTVSATFRSSFMETVCPTPLESGRSDRSIQENVCPTPNITDPSPLPSEENQTVTICVTTYYNETCEDCITSCTDNCSKSCIIHVSTISNGNVTVKTIQVKMMAPYVTINCTSYCHRHTSNTPSNSTVKTLHVGMYITAMYCSEVTAAAMIATFNENHSHTITTIVHVT